MSNFVRIIKECEAAEGGGSKLAIREALADMDSAALRLIWEALNPYRVYGVKKFPWPTSFLAKSVTGFDTFFTLLDKLATRQLTGNAAKTELTATLAAFDEETALYLARVIDKDLKAGFSDETVNKVLIAREMLNNDDDATLESCLKAVDKLLKDRGFKQFEHYKIYPNLIPLFTVQLADKCEEEEDFENIEFPAIADVKYDGERNVAIVTDEVHYFSRSGKEVFHLPISIDAELLRIRKHLGYDFVLDGERFGKDFEATMNAKKGAKNKEVPNEAREGLHFRAFFLMPLTDWQKQETKITMEEARAFLEDLLPKMDCKKIIISTAKVVNNYNEMMDWCNHVIDEMKMEGLIVKKMKDVYRWERNTAWLKIKRFYPVDGCVVGWYFGRPGSRTENVMGGVIVEGTDEKGRKFRCCVGSGFGDDIGKHKLPRNTPKMYENATLEIKFQEFTQPKPLKGTDMWCLRFPTVTNLRTDKSVPALQDKRWFGITHAEAVKLVNELRK
jgi:DNA ligase-1